MSFASTNAPLNDWVVWEYDCQNDGKQTAVVEHSIVIFATCSLLFSSFCTHIGNVFIFIFQFLHSYWQRGHVFFLKYLHFRRLWNIHKEIQCVIIIIGNCLASPRYCQHLIVDWQISIAAQSTMQHCLSFTQHILSIPFALKYSSLKNLQKVEICGSIIKKRM